MGTMTAKELMISRFEVIADYPLCRYNIGGILTPIKEGSSRYECLQAPSSELVSFPEKYPHLFRQMNWWEKRTSDQMPNKVKFSDDVEFFNIEYWDMNKGTGLIKGGIYDSLEIILTYDAPNLPHILIPID